MPRFQPGQFFFLGLLLQRGRLRAQLLDTEGAVGLHKSWSTRTTGRLPLLPTPTELQLLP